MLATVIGAIIALIVLGVLLWAARRLISLIPMEPWIAQVVDVLLVVIVVLVVVFYVILPLLGVISGGGLHLPNLPR